ncbi:MAG: glucuronate isomerase [Lentisphaerae bacterium]|nr:glucuronate isomerase [Lentisphaerota bacterium]
MPKVAPAKLQAMIKGIVTRQPVVDIHTHLFDPAMGALCLWGIDELLTYHYIVSEFFCARPDIDYQSFFNQSKAQQADLIWTELFIRRSPISEACRGVLTILQALGLDPKTKSLAAFRRYFNKQKIAAYTAKVFKLAAVDYVYMTNDPLDATEHKIWQKGFERDPRFLGALRLDSALMAWPRGVARLQALGYAVDEALTGKTLAEVRRYLNDWCQRIKAHYMGISLPPSFRYPERTSSLNNLLVQAVLPVARERGLPLALMLGVKKLTNPALGLAGDSVAKSEIETLEQLAADFADNRFLVTYLARENMHELCVAARKFKNITPFGCWWFLNTPSLIEEITATRLELLGLSFIPQHSDARVLEQLIYKWDHARTVIARVLTEKYADLTQAGWPVSAAEVRRDFQILFGAARLRSP